MKRTTIDLAPPLIGTLPLIGALLLAGCGGAGVPEATSADRSADTAANPSTGPSSPSSSKGSVEGTVVRFTAGSETLDVTIDQDSPATRDFLSMLPTSLQLEEFNGREKIADLPRELDWQGSPGSDPEDGDVIFYVPWGNIGFYYNTDGIGYSDQTIHLGSYDATQAQLEQFEGQETSVEVVA